MFTGLIEAVGEVAEVKPTPGGLRMRIDAPLAAQFASGDSIAINGVCLTVVSADSSGFHADVSPETMRVTTLGTIRRSALVNIERALRADSRMGGHFVQGHVDATATVDDIRQEGESYWLTVKFPPELGAYIVRKGSIAVNGISLTVAGVDQRHFDVQVIPFTWSNTNLHAIKPGDVVNVECDILGKYVARSLELAARP